MVYGNFSVLNRTKVILVVIGYDDICWVCSVVYIYPLTMWCHRCLDKTTLECDRFCMRYNLQYNSRKWLKYFTKEPQNTTFISPSRNLKVPWDGVDQRRVRKSVLQFDFQTWQPPWLSQCSWLATIPYLSTCS